MKLISHRGNLSGPEPNKENSPGYILQAIDRGYDVEVDLWGRKSLWLGHDKPEYPCPISFLVANKNKLWIHCKNQEAIFTLINFNTLNFFYHDQDDCALTSKGFLWTYPNKNVCSQSVLVIDDATKYNGPKCFGLCSDKVR